MVTAIISKPNDPKFKAKRISISSLYTERLKQTGKVLLGKCPFHDDHNPSFAIYPETNTWNCFSGCGGGDSINFYMKLHSCDFQTALREMV